MGMTTLLARGGWWTLWKAAHTRTSSKSPQNPHLVEQISAEGRDENVETEFTEKQC
jgi:hypothetical protein